MDLVPPPPASGNAAAGSAASEAAIDMARWLVSQFGPYPSPYTTAPTRTRPVSGGDVLSQVGVERTFVISLRQSKRLQDLPERMAHLGWRWAATGDVEGGVDSSLVNTLPPADTPTPLLPGRPVAEHWPAVRGCTLAALRVGGDRQPPPPSRRRGDSGRDDDDNDHTTLPPTPEAVVSAGEQTGGEGRIGAQKCPPLDPKHYRYPHLRTILTAEGFHSLTNHRSSSHSISSVSEIGCFLSHWAVWDYVVENNLRAVLVFEDDVDSQRTDVAEQLAHLIRQFGDVARPLGVSNPLDTFDVLSCGTYSTMGHGGGPFRPRRFDALPGVARLEAFGDSGIPYCTQGYVITQRGARYLRDHMLPASYQVDMAMYLRAQQDPHFRLWVTEPEALLEHDGVLSAQGRLRSFHDVCILVPPTLLGTYALVVTGIIVLTLVVLFLVFVVRRFRNGRGGNGQMRVTPLAQWTPPIDEAGAARAAAT